MDGDLTASSRGVAGAHPECDDFDAEATALLPSVCRMPRVCVPGRHHQRRKVLFKSAAVLAMAVTGLGLRAYAGDLPAPWNPSSDALEARRLEGSDKPAICRSVYNKVHPNANRIRGKDLTDSKKEIIREGKSCTTAKRSVSVFAISIAVVLYMFVGIAIICDELFVPALEQIAENWELSDDVSGATLMAAGGSAPELATSFIGTFQGSTVGLGTIVGSAVFNVLFVIGMCALATPPKFAPLKLTWWPLARDCSYYIVTLACLATWFTVPTPGLITNWEALVQFSLYLGYVTLMSQNEGLEQFVKSRLEGEKYKISPDEAAKSESKEEKAPVPPRCRQSFMSMVTKKDLKAQAGIAIVRNIKGDVKSTFDSLDADHNGTLDKAEFAKILELLGDKTNYHADDVTKLRDTLDIDHDNLISYSEFTLWYISSESRLKAMTRKAFAQFDVNANGYIDVGEVKEVIKLLTLDHPLLASTIDEQVKDFTVVLGSKTAATYEEFQNWYEGTAFWAHHKEEADAHGEDTAGIYATTMQSMRDFGGMPCSEKAGTLVLLPVNLIFALTVPDCRVIGKEKHCYVTFCMSIFWIGACSFGMVECIVNMGCFTGIPIFIMGLTFLAAGTSVPDLLSSVAVAKQGKGDMAVSSSIGSNIFDVAVGLPLPWLVFTLVHGCPVPVGGHANGNGLSVAILLAMVAAVIISIAASGWVMSKKLGYSMFALYFVFIAQELFRNYA